jgi:hypothetical protein
MNHLTLTVQPNFAEVTFLLVRFADGDLQGSGQWRLEPLPERISETLDLVYDGALTRKEIRVIAELDEQGNVRRILRDEANSVAPELIAQVERQVASWKFLPGVTHGLPTKSTVSVRLRFLGDDRAQKDTALCRFNSFEKFLSVDLIPLAHNEGRWKVVCAGCKRAATQSREVGSPKQ